MHYNCLIVDDEKMLADSTAEYFNLFDVSAFALYSAKECLEFFSDSSADLILLDINLSDGSGFELCKKLRETTDAPILFISARTSDDDKIAALSIGGDDYIQKPYSLAVLTAKVKAVLNRSQKSAKSQTHKAQVWSDLRLKIDFAGREVYVENQKIKLRAMEFKLLSYLAANEGKKISKQELFDNVWTDSFVGDGTLNVHIRRLRELIEQDANNPKYITTLWGDGYIFKRVLP